MSSNFMTCLAACVAISLAVGCRTSSTNATDIAVNLATDPSPPVVGEVDVTLTLASALGQPIADAEVQLEGNMNHAGMKPSFAVLKEVAPGRYTGTLEFTMGGDWFILITAKTKDGRTVEHKIDIRGVQRP